MRNLVDGTERTINDKGLQKAQPLFSESDSDVFVAAPTGNTGTGLWQISLTSNATPPKRSTSSDSLRSDAQLIPGTPLVVMGISGRTPITVGTGNAFARGVHTRFAVVDVMAGVEKIYDGESPAISANGKTAAFITRANGRNTLRMMSLQVPPGRDAAEGRVTQRKAWYDGAGESR